MIFSLVRWEAAMLEAERWRRATGLSSLRFGPNTSTARGAKVNTKTITKRVNSMASSCPWIQGKRQIPGTQWAKVAGSRDSFSSLG